MGSHPVSRQVIGTWLLNQFAVTDPSACPTMALFVVGVWWRDSSDSVSVQDDLCELCVDCSCMCHCWVPHGHEPGVLA